MVVNERAIGTLFWKYIYLVKESYYYLNCYLYKSLNETIALIKALFSNRQYKTLHWHLLKLQVTQTVRNTRIQLYENAWKLQFCNCVKPNEK